MPAGMIFFGRRATFLPAGVSCQYMNERCRMNVMYMKRFSAVAFCVSCLTALLSCALDDEYSGASCVGADYVEVWYGRTVRVPLLVKGGPWTVTSSDVSVATASIVGDSLEIRTSKGGYSLVTVAERGSSGRSNVAVYSRDLTYSTWYESESDRFRCRVEVEAADEELQSSLQRELLDKYRGYLSGRRVYRFDPDGAMTVWSPTPNDVGDGRAGTYRFDGRLLVTECDGVTEALEVNVLGTHVLEMMQDLTDEYEALYPEAGVKRVLAVRYFTRRLPD